MSDSKPNKVFISGDAIPSDTIVGGETFETDNCIGQDLCATEKLRSTVVKSENEVKEDIHP